MLPKCKPVNLPRKDLICAKYNVSVLHQNEGGIGKSIPDAQEGGGDGFPNTSGVLVEYGHSPHHQFIFKDGSGNPSLWAGKD